MDAYARFRYTVKADVPEWRNGRRGGLKNRCLTTCEFDSRLGHQFSRFCKAALWVAFFILCQKNGPEGIGFVIQMEGTRETVLRVRKLQRLLMPAARKDEAARWHPPNCQPKTPWGNTKKEGTRLMREARPFVKDVAKNEALFRFRSLLLLRSGNDRLHALDGEHDCQHEQQHGENRL